MAFADLTWPWTALLATWLIATAAAPAFPVNALHMSGRLALAFGVYLLTVNGITSWAAVRAVSVVATVAGALLAGLVMLDFVGVGLVRDWLATFRPFVAHVGNQVRASGVFQYPTIASMYLEVLFAWSLPLLALMVDERRRAATILVLLALLAMTQATVLTFTRAGLVTMLASLAVVAAIRYRARGVDRVVRWLGAVGVLLVIQFAVSYSGESILLRFTTEGTDAWYSASIDAPDRLEIPTGGTRTVRVRVRNTGRVTWDSTLPQPFRLSYHWLTADGTRVVSWEERRTTFPEPVPSGGRVTLSAEVEAPRQPGAYRMLWDIEHEGRLWFRTRTGRLACVVLRRGHRARAGSARSAQAVAATAAGPGRCARGAWCCGRQRRGCWPSIQPREWGRTTSGCNTVLISASWTRTPGSTATTCTWRSSRALACWERRRSQLSAGASPATPGRRWPPRAAARRSPGIGPRMPRCSPREWSPARLPSLSTDSWTRS